MWVWVYASEICNNLYVLQINKGNINRDMKRFLHKSHTTLLLIIAFIDSLGDRT